MQYEYSVEIDATPERVWSVMTDVERWPEWTKSMRDVERLDEGPFAVGSEARVQQPMMPALTWKVTELEPARGFTWESRSPGMRSVAMHRIEPRAGGCTVTLAVQASGPMARLLWPFTAGMTRRYVAMEADGLQREATR